MRPPHNPRWLGGALMIANLQMSQDGFVIPSLLFRQTSGCGGRFLGLARD